MIPPVMGGEVPSDGERQLFAKFRDDPKTKDWVVLHSLDVAKHRSQVTGEIDFIIIIPGQGVVCLEVKACRSLRVEDGRWRYGQSDSWDSRGPFKQASEAMHSLRDVVWAAVPELRHVVFWSAVAFTHMSFDLKSPEWHRWQALDQGFLQTRGVPEAILAVLSNARARLAASPTAKWYAQHTNSPTPKEVSALADVLRPTFESYESPRMRVARAAAEAKKYTEEQYRALDYAEDNDRVNFSGPAGTGKTLLALESARRAAASGRRALFLCYNEMLGKWLEQEVRPLSPKVEFDRVARRMLKISGLNVSDEADFWRKRLPKAAIAVIDEEGSSFQPYDELIVDEAQDFLSGDYIDFLDKCVAGGLAKGRIKLFGDYERQSVHRAAELTINDLKDGWMPDLSTVTLRLNCRNLPRVATLAANVGGLTPGYKGVLREDDRVEPSVLQYADDSDQQKQLLDTLFDLRSEGFPLGDIAVLSMSADNMCMARMNKNGRSSFSAGGSKDSGAITISSIRRFKGLEASVVVVTDIESLGSDDAQKLMYVAATRSLSRLVLLMDAQAFAEYDQTRGKGT